jgi:cysteine desulfurase
MLPYLRNQFGNPSSIYSLGQEARKAVDEAREKVAALIGADPAEIFFTSGGTEANNFALCGIAKAFESKGKHIITSEIEHPSVLETCIHLLEMGFDVTFLSVDKYGVVNPDEVARAITDDTILISIMQANNEVGTIEPISEIANIAQEKGIYMHTDAVQAVGKIELDVNELGVDLLSLAGHKIYGPKGIGALYIKKGTKIAPLIYGGHQEKNLRAGTENVPGIVGLGQACQLAYRDLASQMSYLANLRDRLETGIMDRISQVYLNGHPTERLPHILNVSFESIEGGSVVLDLDMKGIIASAGSACASAQSTPSHVLSSLGIPPEVAKGAVRFSLGRENTPEQIDCVLSTLVEIVDRLRATSVLPSERRKPI